MNVAGSSGISAALLLQSLFSSGSAQASPMPESAAAGQNVPSGDASTNAQGASQAQWADTTMSAMVSLQMQGSPPQPPSASDVASGLIQSLDTDGDGELSLDEIQKAVSAATGQTSATQTTSQTSSTDQTNTVAQAFAAMDTNGDGKISQDELTSAVQSDMSAHKAHHGGGHHHHASSSSSSSGASSAAEGLLSAFDTNGDSELSLDEISNGLGLSGTSGASSSDPLQSLLSSLDTDGDGKLSQSELTTGIQQQMMLAEQAYSSSAAMTASI